jgi:predicted ABC-type ATPase
VVLPIEKIVSRYSKSMANLSAAIELADRAYLYDNSVDDAEARLCVRLQDGLVRKIYCTLPEWVALAIEGRPPHSDFLDARVARS